MSLVRSGAFNLTATDLTRALTSIGLQQQLVEKAERRAGEIELAGELTGNTVSTVVIASDDGVSIRVAPNGDATAFNEFSDLGESS